MQVSVESTEGLEKRMTVELPAERVDEEVEKRLKNLARQVRLDGFRPGKVPFRIVKQRYGAQARQEVYGELIQSTFFEAATQEELRPAGEPSIELKDGAQDDGNFAYIATFEVMPEVELADLGSQSVERPVAEVTDADVDAMIDKLRSQRTTYQDVERAAQDGDRLDLSFKGYIDGEAFDGGAGENVPLVLGSGAMIDGFEDGIIGAMPGEERSIDVTFPEDYRVENLAGKAAKFDVTVNKVAEPVMPELNEEFIKSFGVEDGTEEGLRAEVRNNMQTELENKLSAATKEKVMDMLIAAHQLTVPKVMIDAEAQRMLEQTKANMQAQGAQSDFEMPASVFAEEAERRVALGLIVGKIISDQGLTADEEKVREAIEKFASTYQDPAQVVEYFMNNQEQRASIESLVLEDQVVEWALSQVAVEDKQTTFDELTAG